MAVSYAGKVSTQDKLFFLRILCRWSGSVWQLIWVDLVVYIMLYLFLAFMYRKVLAPYEESKAIFELVVLWVRDFRTAVPLSFLLGFFVSAVLNRWWAMCTLIPWMAGPSFEVQNFIRPEHPDKAAIARKVRVTVLRWMNLSWILIMGELSMHVKQRFCFQRANSSATCTNRHKGDYKITWRQRLALINKDSKVSKYFGCLVTTDEMEVFQKSAELSNDDDYSYTPEFWLPLVWASRLLSRAKLIGCIGDDRHYVDLLRMLQNFRLALRNVWVYSEFNIPLVYTQVVVMAVYTFLLTGLLSSQIINHKNDRTIYVQLKNGTKPVTAPILAYLPLIPAFELIFYLGWFKIGMMLINPLGKDEGDIPLSDILNNNLKSSTKTGASEESLLPPGLFLDGPPETQILSVLNSFDFSLVRAHDKFQSREETEAQLHKELVKKMRKQHWTVRKPARKNSLANVPKIKMSKLKRENSQDGVSEKLSDVEVGKSGSFSNNNEGEGATGNGNTLTKAFGVNLLKSLARARGKKSGLLDVASTATILHKQHSDGDLASRSPRSQHNSVSFVVEKTAPLCRSEEHDDLLFDFNV